jgi:hypothetical protein
MIDLKKLQSVLYDVQQVMSGYSQDDTWSDYDRQAHDELIKMQYAVEDELKIHDVELLKGVIDKLINQSNPKYSIEENKIIKDSIDKHFGKGV